MRDEVLPYVPDAWVDHEKTKIGYEIPLTRHFYRYVPPRPLEEIDAEIEELEEEIQRSWRGGRVTEVRPLRAYAEVTLGRQRSPANDSGPFMVPYLRAGNVTDGTLNLTDVKEMNFSPSEQEIFGLRHGDVLVTEGSGSLSSVGASAVWRGEIGATVCFQNTLYVSGHELEPTHGSWRGGVATRSSRGCLRASPLAPTYSTSLLRGCGRSPWPIGPLTFNEALRNISTAKPLRSIV